MRQERAAETYKAKQLAAPSAVLPYSYFVDKRLRISHSANFFHLQSTFSLHLVYDVSYLWPHDCNLEYSYMICAIEHFAVAQWVCIASTPQHKVHFLNEFLVKGIRLVPRSIVSELCFLYGRVHMSSTLSALGLDTYTVSQRNSLESFTAPPCLGISEEIFCLIDFNNT